MFVFLILAAAAGGWIEGFLQHGLSCKYNTDRRFPRHSAMNDVIKRAIQKADLPLVLELPALNRGDGLGPEALLAKTLCNSPPPSHIVIRTNCSLFTFF